MNSRKIKIEHDVVGPDLNPVVLLERLPKELVDDIIGRTKKVEIESESPEQVSERSNKRSRKNFKNEEESEEESEENRCKNKRELRDRPEKKKQKMDSDADSDADDERMPRYPDSSNDEFGDFKVRTKRSGRNMAWIDTIKTLPTNTFRSELRKLLMANIDVSSGSKTYRDYVWSIFVQYMRDKNCNPFEASAADFDHFLRLLEDSRVSKQVVRAKDLLLECANDFGIANVDRAALEELGHEQKASSNTCSTSSYYLMQSCRKWSSQNFFNAFIIFCNRSSTNVNPFLCDAADVASYLEVCLKNLSRINTIASRKSLLKEIARKIDFFRKESCDAVTHFAGIAKSDLVAEVLFMAESIDLGLDPVFEPRSLRNKIIDATPDCKYLKYSQAHHPSKFWTEKKVNFAISQAFRKPVDDEEGSTLPKTACLLGTSLEMLLSHKPGIQRPQVLREFANENREKYFWSGLSEVSKMIRAVRQRDVSITEGAFQLGAAVEDLKHRVGPLNSPPKAKAEVKKVAAKPKLNPLEKEINFYEDEGMSDYEKIRLKNIQERFALFNQLNFNAAKAGCLRHIKSAPKEELLPREKSRRLKKIQAHQSQQNAGVSLDLSMVPNIPPCKVLLEDISSLEQPLSNSIKFLSALEQEIKWSKIEKKRDENSNVINLESGITVKAVCIMSTVEILSAAVLPSRHIDVVCTGDKAGNLGIWLVQTDEESPTDNQTTYAKRRNYSLFKPHSKEINAVSFHPFRESCVVTSSSDGFIRMTDLNSEQTVDVVYKWYNHSLDRELSVSSVGHHAFVSPNEMVVSKMQQDYFYQDHLANSGSASVFIYDVRTCSMGHMLGKENSFKSPIVSVHPNNPRLIAGIVDKSVKIFDLRKMKNSFLEIQFAARPATPLVAEFSPSDGNKLLVATKSFNKYGDTSYLARVINLDRLDECKDERFLGSDEFFTKLVPEKSSRHLVHNGNRRCVWHPSRAEAFLALASTRTQKLDGSVLTAVDRNGEESFSELHFYTHYGLVSESKSSTLLALNSHDNGSVAFMKF